MNLFGIATIITAVSACGWSPLRKVHTSKRYILDVFSEEKWSSWVHHRRTWYHHSYIGVRPLGHILLKYFVRNFWPTQFGPQYSVLQPLTTALIGEGKSSTFSYLSLNILTRARYDPKVRCVDKTVNRRLSFSTL